MGTKCPVYTVPSGIGDLLLVWNKFLENQVTHFIFKGYTVDLSHMQMRCGDDKD